MLSMGLCLLTLSTTLGPDIVIGSPAEKLTIGPGTYVVPDGALVQVMGDVDIAPGVTVELGEGASVVVRGLLRAVGSAEDPIVFTWKTENQPWGNIVLADPECNGSIVRYCVFEHATNRIIGGEEYKGALSAVGVDIEITDSVFHDITGEDGVNVVDAYGVILRCRFDGCPDAIDYDGSEGGIIADSEFSNIRDDAIDLGEGSVAYCYNNRIHDAGDKGVSVGERSHSYIYNNIISGANMGIAIKDSSDPVIYNNTFIGNNIGVSAYEKNIFMGGGRGVVANCIIWDSDSLVIDLDSKSTTVFNYNNIEAGWQGEGNIDSDPLLTTWEGYEFFLQADSPCVDAGAPDVEDGLYGSSPGWPEGFPNGPRSDIGAYGGPDNAEWIR